jgi:hypothetical protein
MIKKSLRTIFGLEQIFNEKYSYKNIANCGAHAEMAF